MIWMFNGSVEIEGSRWVKRFIGAETSWLRASVRTADNQSITFAGFAGLAGVVGTGGFDRGGPSSMPPGTDVV